MPTFRYIMFLNPVPGREAEFNTWYEHVHLPDIAATGCFRSGERFEVMPSRHTPQAEHRYASIYEVDGSDPEAALGKLVESFESGRMRMSDAMDMASSRPVLLRSMGVTLP